MENKPPITKTQIAIFAIALFNIIIHLAVYKNLEYHRDELLYFSLGLHPGFGYASVPPMIGWLAFMLKIIFGSSLFAVKIFPAILGGIFIILASSIAKELGGKAYAQILTAISVILMPTTLRTFHLFQPVHIDLFFWTLIFYIIILYLNTQNTKYLILTGAVFGLAMLNKYLIALLLPALFIPVIFTNFRNIFHKRQLYFGIALGLIIFLPNLIWQFMNDLPVINHMNELNRQQLVNVNRIDFLIDQLLMPFAAGFLLIFGLFYLWKSVKYRFLLFSTLIVVLALFFLKGKSYYTIGIFPILIASGAVAVEKLIKSKILQIALPVIMVLITIPILPFGMPIYKEDKLVAYYKGLEDKYGLVIGRKFEDGSIHSLPQDYADQLGWEELTTIAAKAYNRIPDKSKSFIYCENYGQAGAISVIGKKYLLPEAVSFSESFKYWKPNDFEPDIEYLIYINDELGEDLKEVFQNIELIGAISNKNAREYGTSVYLCSLPVSSFNEFWKSRLLDIQ